MGFTDDQLRALNRRVPARRVKIRISDGKELSYIEGWFALEQANEALNQLRSGKLQGAAVLMPDGIR